MSADDRVCPLTHRDTGQGAMPSDWFVCRTCTSTLRGLLTDLPGLMTDLDVALAGQVHFIAQRGETRTETPDPEDARWPQTTAVTRAGFAAGPSEAGWVARQTILTWVDWVTAVRGHTVPQTWTDVGTYLRAAVDWIARHPDGPQAIDELTAGIRQARQAIDRPADQHYLGLCPTCTHALYAPDHAHTITCPRCTTHHQTADLRARLVTRIEHHTMTATDASRVLAEVGIDIPARLIRLWKHRGELTPAVDIDGRPLSDNHGRSLYEVGAILTRHAVTA